MVSMTEELRLEIGRIDKAKARAWEGLSEAGRRPVGQWEGEREQYAARLRGRSDKEFDRGVEQGRRLAMDPAIDEALEASAGRERRAPALGWHRG
jgi:hypothetical protein